MLIVLIGIDTLSGVCCACNCVQCSTIRPWNLNKLPLSSMPQMAYQCQTADIGIKASDSFSFPPSHKLRLLKERPPPTHHSPTPHSTPPCFYPACLLQRYCRGCCCSSCRFCADFKVTRNARRQKRRQLFCGVVLTFCGGGDQQQNA